MASSSPAAPDISVEAVYNEDLATFGSDSAIECHMSPRIQEVQDNDVASAWMLPDASDEEDPLAAGEFS